MQKSSSTFDKAPAFLEDSSGLDFANGKLYAVANGVFFVALEDNGHVYAYVLNNDESVVQIVLNGTENPKITHVSPASGVNTSANNEGFAIADATYTVNGQRPVYRFCDGVTSGALTIGSIDCSYTPSGKPDIDKPVAPNDPSGQPAVPSEKTDGSAADSGAAANAPGTGDESPVGVWAGLLILSAGTLVAVLILQRRKHIR